jgi:hypothetical protein
VTVAGSSKPALVPVISNPAGTGVSIKQVTAVMLAPSHVPHDGVPHQPVCLGWVPTFAPCWHCLAKCKPVCLLVLQKAAPAGPMDDQYMEEANPEYNLGRKSAQVRLAASSRVPHRTHRGWKRIARLRGLLPLC